MRCLTGLISRVMVLFCLFTVSAWASIHYVTPGGTGDGSSWARAFGDLQVAIETAAARADLGVYFPPGGNWYIFGTQRGFFTDQFGFAGTRPLGGPPVMP